MAKHDRLTVGKVAKLLKSTPEAIRRRIRRGTPPQGAKARAEASKKNTPYQSSWATVASAQPPGVYTDYFALGGLFELIAEGIVYGNWKRLGDTILWIIVCGGLFVLFIILVLAYLDATKI
jgi:hypothetical protein